MVTGYMHICIRQSNFEAKQKDIFTHQIVDLEGVHYYCMRLKTIQDVSKICNYNVRCVVTNSTNINELMAFSLKCYNLPVRSVLPRKMFVLILTGTKGELDEAVKNSYDPRRENTKQKTHYQVYVHPIGII